MRFSLIIAVTSLSLVGCGMNAASHDPAWITTVAGDYEDVQACTFDELRAHGGQPNLSSSINKRLQTARIWDGASTIGSIIMEMTFVQTAPNQVRVEYRNTLPFDNTSIKTRMLNVVKGCQSG